MRAFDSLGRLETGYAAMRDGLERQSLARLPTPVAEARLKVAGATGTIWIKRDDRSAVPYGGNKVRKLEYLLGRIDRARFERVATFGTVASHHALATAVYSRQLGFEPIAFLAHQTRSAAARAALNMHLELGTELVPWGGARAERIALLRRHLWHRRAAVVPLGGSSWTGCVGFVNAGLELAAQVAAGELPAPTRIYVASGTMGTAAGLGLGLALAGLPAVVHAVRVSPETIANRAVLDRLMGKTCRMLQRIDPGFPAELHGSARVILRHEFFGPGYAKSTPEVEAAIETAAEQAGLRLEATYSGKAMQALISDLRECARRGERPLFWNTAHSGALPVATDEPADAARLPQPFLRYFDQLCE